MPQIASESEMETAKITALERLLSGDTVVSAAKAAGVNRSTLHRWLREDYDFQANYNARKRTLLETSEARLLALAETAVDVVSAALERGDSR